MFVQSNDDSLIETNGSAENVETEHEAPKEVRKEEEEEEDEEQDEEEEDAGHVDDNDSNTAKHHSDTWKAHYAPRPVLITHFFPPAAWVPAYYRTLRGRPTLEDNASDLEFSLKGDLAAGLTVGVLLVPQCLAYALLADLPVQTGLYSSVVPLVMYAAFGTIRQVQNGPTALLCLLVGQALDSLDLIEEDDRVAGACLLAVLVGLVSLVLGVLRAGFIVDFMSHTVMSAFCSAAGITIATSQVKHMLGISFDRETYWWKTVGAIATHLDETSGVTVAMSAPLLCLLLTLKYWKSAGGKDKRLAHKIWRFFPVDKTTRIFKGLKFVADTSSLFSVVVGWLWALAYRQAGVTGLDEVGAIDSAGFTVVTPGDGILDDVKWNLFLQAAAVMAVVGYLETIAVGGKFAMAARYDYDPNQELIALGISNALGSVFGSFPTTGSFSRTAVNAMFGATSLIAVMVSASVVAVAMLCLLPLVERIPLASLAPIIIQGAIGVISPCEFVTAFKASLPEFCVMFFTFGVSLALTVKEGLLVGFVLSIMKTMYELANPNLAVLGQLPNNTFRDVRNFSQAKSIPNSVVIRMDARLSFANARKMKEFAIRAVHVREQQGDTIRFVVIDSKAVNNVDLTAVEMLEGLALTLESRNQSLIVANIKGPVSRYLHSTSVPKHIKQHGGHLCIDMEHALAIVSGVDVDGSAAEMHLKSLVTNVNSAKKLIQKEQCSHMRSCAP